MVDPPARVNRHGSVQQAREIVLEVVKLRTPRAGVSVAEFDEELGHAVFGRLANPEPRHTPPPTRFGDADEW